MLGRRAVRILTGSCRAVELERTRTCRREAQALYRLAQDEIVEEFDRVLSGASNAVLECFVGILARDRKRRAA